MRECHRNILLKTAHSECLATVEDRLERTELEKGQIIVELGRSMRWVYLVETGLISVISHPAKHQDIELGVIGREGMTGEGGCAGRRPLTLYLPDSDSGLRITNRGRQTARSHGFKPAAASVFAALCARATYSTLFDRRGEPTRHDKPAARALDPHNI